MKKDFISQIIVKENKIGILKVGNINYISLTDLARYANWEEPKVPIQTWMRNKDVILYLGLWEKINNNSFKGYEFTTFEQSAGRNSFYMSPQKWIKETNAIGIISKSGNNGGTFAHPDIAFEFASWLSPEFKLYLITEFERLKTKEAEDYKIEWNATRLLSKINYAIHTDSINNCIVPNLSLEQRQLIYAEEADVINVALFGMTAKQWQDGNKELSKKGNIRDYTDLLHLVILNNLQSTNAELIKQKIPQNERLLILNNSAKRQIEILKNNQSMIELQKLQNEINDLKQIK